MQSTLTAFILRHRIWGETDLLVTLLTEQGQKLDCIAKGAGGKTSKRRSHLEHFNLVNVTLYQKNDRHYLQDVECLNCFYHVKQDLGRISSAAKLSKLIETHTSAEEDPRWFKHFQGSLESLRQKPWDSNQEASSLRSCLQIAGLEG